jgi:hypothetical protein
MGSQVENRVSGIIQAYFTLPHNEYAEIITGVRSEGGLTPAEVRTLKDQLLFVHSDTIIRQAGLSDSCEGKTAVP